MHAVITMVDKGATKNVASIENGLLSDTLTATSPEDAKTAMLSMVNSLDLSTAQGDRVMIEVRVIKKRPDVVGNSSGNAANAQQGQNP